MQGIILIMFPLTYAALVCSLTCVTISVVCDTCSDGGQTIYLFHFCGSIVAFFSKYKKKKRKKEIYASLLHSIFSSQLLFFSCFHSIFFFHLLTHIWFLQGELPSQANVTIKMEKNLRACCKYEVQVGSYCCPYVPPSSTGQCSV